MSWEDQGRQEHGWFGNGTAAPKAGAGGSEAELRRPDAAGSADAAARAYAWAKRHGPALFGLPPSGMVLEGFAEAVMRLERARPGTLARALGYFSPFGVFIPGTPENEAWVRSAGRALDAAGNAIGHVFNSQSQGGDASAPPVPGATPGRRTNGPSTLWENPAV